MGSGQHRRGRPARPPNPHRLANRPALLFHEMIHWLGREHTADRPDLAPLYATP